MERGQRDEHSSSRVCGRVDVCTADDCLGKAEYTEGVRKRRRECLFSKLASALKVHSNMRGPHPFKIVQADALPTKTRKVPGYPAGIRRAQRFEARRARLRRLDGGVYEQQGDRRWDGALVKAHVNTGSWGRRRDGSREQGCPLLGLWSIEGNCQLGHGLFTYSPCLSVAMLRRASVQGFTARELRSWSRHPTVTAPGQSAAIAAMAAMALKTWILDDGLASVTASTS